PANIHRHSAPGWSQSGSPAPLPSGCVYSAAGFLPSACAGGSSAPPRPIVDLIPRAGPDRRRLASSRPAGARGRPRRPPSRPTARPFPTRTGPFPRHDYLVNIVQSIVEALLFYHPAVWWISCHIRTERELCCDDLAVSVTGDAVAYARALAEIA